MLFFCTTCCELSKVLMILQCPSRVRTWCPAVVLLNFELFFNGAQSENNAMYLSPNSCRNSVHILCNDIHVNVSMLMCFFFFSVFCATTEIAIVDSRPLHLCELPEESRRPDAQPRRSKCRKKSSFRKSDQLIVSYS